MYRFLDRPLRDLPPGEQMILWSMRSWVAAAMAERCPCTALAPSFARWRVDDLLAAFSRTMFLLNEAGQGQLRFGQPGCAMVHDDEARLLVLFHAAAEYDEFLTRRLADQIVKPSAISDFVIAVVESADVLRRTPVPRD